MSKETVTEHLIAEVVGWQKQPGTAPDREGLLKWIFQAAQELNRLNIAEMAGEIVDPVADLRKNMTETTAEEKATILREWGFDSGEVLS